MKDCKIFVEGVADKCFVEQLVAYMFGAPLVAGSVINTDGYTNLMAQDAYTNQMRRTTDDGGVNLVIFDADDDFEERRKAILEWGQRKGVEFELFLFPNNEGRGALEDLLEKIINPENSEVMDCWERYEDTIKDIRLPWRKGEPLTIPAKKTKIYAYLEVLLGDSKAEKKKIKEANRDYTNRNHWDLNAPSLARLAVFLKDNLQ